MSHITDVWVVDRMLSDSVLSCITGISPRLRALRRRPRSTHQPASSFGPMPRRSRGLLAPALLLRAPRVQHDRVELPPVRQSRAVRPALVDEFRRAGRPPRRRPNTRPTSSMPLYREALSRPIIQLPKSL